MIVETFFLVVEKRAMRTPIFQDLLRPASGQDNSKKSRQSRGLVSSKPFRGHRSRTKPRKIRNPPNGSVLRSSATRPPVRPRMPGRAAGEACRRTRGTGPVSYTHLRAHE